MLILCRIFQNVIHLFVPAERKIPKVRIETRQSESLSKQRIIVAIDSWPRNSKYPLGHFIRALGNVGDKETENEVLLLEHDVPHSRFSDAVLSFLPKMPWTISENVNILDFKLITFFLQKRFPPPPTNPIRSFRLSQKEKI